MDTGNNESHHKTTKVAAKLTQRDITVFELQTAKRLCEFILVDLAMAEMDGLNMWEYLALNQERGARDVGQEAEVGGQFAGDGGEPTTGGTALEVFYDPEEDDFAWKYRNRPSTKGSWDEEIVKFLYYLLEMACDMHGVADLDIRTEHKRNGHIFRGHPDYRKRGQWNDWAKFDWGAGHGVLPGEIWCFVDFTDVPDDFLLACAGCKVGKGVYAVVESTSYCPNQDKSGRPMNNSEMFTPIVKDVERLKKDGSIGEKRFYLADVESIVEPMAVFPDIGSSNKVRCFEVLPQKLWSEAFVKWLEAAHTHDVDEMDTDDEK